MRDPFPPMALVEPSGQPKATQPWVAFVSHRTFLYKKIAV